MMDMVTKLAKLVVSNDYLMVDEWLVHNLEKLVRSNY